LFALRLDHLECRPRHTPPNLRQGQLPGPEVNAGLQGYEVDFFWRTERLVVEIDGFAFHSSRRSFESDRRRDATLAAAGVRVMRVTWRQLDSEPQALLVRLAQALVRSG
jgi:very-short-patch-repair endonuclease